MPVGLKLQDYKIFALTYSTSSWLHIFHWILISSYAAWPGVIYFISSYFITICSESLVRQLSWDELQAILCLTQTSYMSTYLFFFLHVWTHACLFMEGHSFDWQGMAFHMCEHTHACSCKYIHLTAKGWPWCHSSVSDHLELFVGLFVVSPWPRTCQ